MSEYRPELRPDDRLLSALADIGILGEWSFDYEKQLFRSSEGISYVFGLDLIEGERGIPVEVYDRAVHPNDVAWLRSIRSSSPGPSGLRVTELRVRGLDGVERWIMVRGRFILDKNDTPVLGYGVMLDLTGYRASGDHSLVTPKAPFAYPLVDLLQSLSIAYRAAKQLSLYAIQRLCQTLLVQTRRTLMHDHLWSGSEVKDEDKKNKLH